VAIGDISDTVKQYQEQFFASLPPETKKVYRFVEPVAFGFTPHDTTEISKLVLHGIKTATGSLLWSYQADGKSLPCAGDFWIAIDGDSNPVCVVQTVNVEIIPFNEVPEDYARWGRRRLLAGELAPNVLAVHCSGMRTHWTRPNHDRAADHGTLRGRIRPAA
jgi:uncharacterized protein YhfF